MLGGEAFLERMYNTYRSMTGPSGTNVWNTALLIGWDEPGGTYDHVAPGAGPAPGSRTHQRAKWASGSIARATGSPPSSCRRGSSQGSVYNEEYRHTSLIATLRKTWDLGEAFTRRDASARTFDHVFALETPRDPNSWVTVEAQPVPAWTLDIQSAGAALSTLGKAIGPGLIELAKKMGVKLPPELDGPSPEFTPELLVQFLREICLHIFPALAPSAAGDAAKPLTGC